MRWLAPRFGEIAERVLEEKKLLAPGTYENCKYRFRRLVAYFGNYRIASIDEKAWGEYVRLRRLESPRCRFFDEWKYLRQALRIAREAGYIEKLPRLHNPDIPVSPGKEITRDELDRLLAAANPELRFQINLAVRTGLRLREMLGLEWVRICLVEKAIRLLPGDTKTRRGRIVPIPASLLFDFQARERTRRSPFVFPSPKSPLFPQNDNRSAWTRCKRKAGVTARWHDLRHTAVTRMIRAGLPPAVIGRIVGMGLRMISRYEHLTAEDLRKAINEVDG